MSEAINFVLAGNGGYSNRGCEAIVRGTSNILRKVYSNPQCKVYSFFRSVAEYSVQVEAETDPSIKHFNLGFNRFDGIWLERQFKKVLMPNLAGQVPYRSMVRNAVECKAVLSIGGDNYTLDYGIPQAFTDLDDAVLNSGIPLVIWGASIGPFAAMPAYERRMGEHLKRATAVFVRESVTEEYLRSIGVSDNVYSTADPAFLLDPSRPTDGFEPEKGSIGINLSPLLAKYVTDGDVSKWVVVAAEMIVAVARVAKRKIYLVPHVTVPHSNDSQFLAQVKSILPRNLDVSLIPGKYTASELKYIISHFEGFVGARTHSTIAALSSGVPTLSLAYSIKAKGINKDIFNHTDYCVSMDALKIDMLAHKVAELLESKSEIQRFLEEKMPGIRRKAESAGETLKKILS